MRICFIAPSGYGKSTAVNYLENKYGARNIKIADFLYEVQNYIYGRMGINTNGSQDGELLQFLGLKVRKIDSSFLLRDFERKVNNCECALILNDDCRPFDYDYLKSLGFIFVNINGFSRGRNDLTSIDKKNKTEWQDLPLCDYTLDNLGGMHEYYENIDKLMKEIKHDRQVLRNTSTKKM